jgi:carbamate kinase
MSKEDADIEVNKGNYVLKQNDGYRRVVAAPQPIDIVEIEAIKTLADADQVVIACGGGGIPVIEQQHVLKGASAVIEKDSIAGKLASDLKADELLILTNVDYVYLNYGKENEQPIKSMSVEEAKKYIEEGQFGETDMLPKINAAIAYLAVVPKGKVIITSLKKTADVISEKVGTIITK